MFSTARQIFILERGEEITLKTGIVENIGIPSPKYSTTIPNLYGQQMEMVVDIKVKVGDETIELQKLPTNLDVFRYGNAIVACTREAMNAEIESLIRTSEDVLKSVPQHEKTIKSCNQFLMDLNPQFAKDKKQEERISGMEHRMGGIESTLQDIQGMLSAALNNKK